MSEKKKAPGPDFLERLEKLILQERARKRKQSIMQLERCWELSNA